MLQKSAPTLTKLTKQFATSRLKSKRDDPDEWIMKLEKLQSHISEMSPKAISKDVLKMNLMIHILNNLPEEYDNQVEQLEDKLNNTTEPLNLKTIRENLNLRYERLNNKDDDDEDNEDKEEKALVMTQFKGRCWKCGKYGHKGADCRSMNKGKSTYFNGKCNYCHKQGHKEADCRKKKADQANISKEEDMTWDVVLYNN